MSPTSKAAHTPGPLRKGYGATSHAIEIYGLDNKTFALLPLPPNAMGECTDKEARARQEANADLFLASPDLLADAKERAENCPACQGRGERNVPPIGITKCSMCANTRAAIAKATTP